MSDAITLPAGQNLPANRPNILMLFSDQHHAQLAGFMGSRIVRTPNLDRLASQGAAFTNAYCNSPLCSPSRQSFMSGRYVHQIGVWDNTAAMPEDTVTWAHMLSAAGYETALVGKMHFNGYQKMYGFDRRPVLEGSNATGASFHSWGVRASVDWSRPTPQYPGIPRDVKSAGPDTPQRQPIFQKDLEVLAGTLKLLQEKGRQARAAQKPARGKKAKGPKTAAAAQPWAICAGFVLPHPPFKARRDILKTYTGQGDLPANRHGENRDACDRALQWYTGELAKNLTDAQIRRAREVYFALITEFDEYAGKILDELDRQGLADNTVVFYFSDHGEMAGEHGLWSKITLLESSIRVPLVVRWPGQSVAGSRIDTPVSLIDLFPTFTDIAGMPLPPPLQLPGKSLRPLLQAGLHAATGRADDGGGSRFIFGEFAGEGWNHPRCFVRRGRYKFVYNHTADMRLYDLEKDPLEMEDLHGQPALQAVEQAFVNYLTTFWDPRQIEAEVRQSQTRRKLARCKNVGQDLGW